LTEMLVAYDSALEKVQRRSWLCKNARSKAFKRRTAR
jgi:hypothetical protein